MLLESPWMCLLFFHTTLAHFRMTKASIAAFPWKPHTHRSHTLALMNSLISPQMRQELEASMLPNCMISGCLVLSNGKHFQGFRHTKVGVVSSKVGWKNNRQTLDTRASQHKHPSSL